MNTEKINLLSPVISLSALDIKDLREIGEELLITLNDDACYDIYPGQFLYLKRNIFRDDDTVTVLSDRLTVLDEDENHVIHTTVPPYRKVMVDARAGSRDAMKDLRTDRTYQVVRFTDSHGIYAQDLDLEYASLAPVDPEFIQSGFTSREFAHRAVFYDYEGNEIGAYGIAGVPLKREDTLAVPEHCLSYSGSAEACGKDFREAEIYRYDFLPEKISENEIAISVEDFPERGNAAYMISRYNPFYWYYVNVKWEGEERIVESDIRGREVRHCVLYADSWWDGYFRGKGKTQVSSGNRIYVNCGHTGTIIGRDTSYWNMGVGLTSDNEYTSLGTEDAFSTSFVTDLENSMVPDIIDMERLKYFPMAMEGKTTLYYKWTAAGDSAPLYTTEWLTPDNTADGTEVDVYVRNGSGGYDRRPSGARFVVYSSLEDGVRYNLMTEDMLGGAVYYDQTDEVEQSGSGLTVATAITLDFHFRRRLRIPDSERSGNTVYTSGNVYYDAWNIGSESVETVWWNGMTDNNRPYEGERFDADVFAAFMEKHGRESDLIGFLNFTDNDVYYRKQKVSRSFVRLNFYSTNNPLTQKLLFSSTVFLDGGTLYGKYIRQHNYLRESGILDTLPEEDPEYNPNAVVVMCSATAVSARVDTELVITNEFDRTRSAEGFNIYLFAEDRMYAMKDGRRTIYMKVEFNHAGNGRTIPMMQWPRSGNTYVPLTVDNFMESLYIPVELMYLDGKYSYFFRTADFTSGGNITMVLFEPKMDYEPEEN